MKTKILYLSYNGMNEALGASQVLSYLYQLSDEYEYHLVSLEKPKDFRDPHKMEALHQSLQDKNIFWYPMEYKTDKFGKMFNFFRLLWASKKIVRQQQIKFAHARSYFPALVANLLGLTYLFDTRGFAFDERADVGSVSRKSVVFSALKKIEKKLYRDAAGVNKLSYEGKRTIESNELFQGGEDIKPITVIPTCTDTERFMFHERTYDGPVKIGYVGTATGWYDFNKTLATLAAIGQHVDYRFIVFNGGQHDFIKEKLKEFNIPMQKVSIESVSFRDMPQRLKEMEVALFYIHPYFSKRASAATKLGEFFASGIPVLTNAGVGDHEKLINEYATGKILDFEQLSSYDFKEIINSLRTINTSKKCRKLAESFFSLEKGVEGYKEMYRKIFC
ncbi:MAG: hypothetical protein WCY77_09810 [Weeksellaceae bacterium]